MMVNFQSIGKKVASFFLLVALCLSVFVANPAVAQARELYGAVNSDGQVWYGEGFKSRELDGGIYLIQFQEGFQSLPAPTVSIYGSPWKTFNMSAAIVEVGPDYLVVQTSSPDRPADSAFTFTVIGD
ncbi:MULTISPECIES: hypothetical protein [Moorena]|uniref:Secreted protein n=2 Tax=Moorena TaxID=1155738 RepID=F4XJX9_9CYAN|nr:MULTISPECIES: hypothetical protein [Moorena]NER86985.1 hypothetical protein [Moorena sp. SIO3A2]NET67407.1 hypothetical protein [Moorena sp. SIO1G6]EGJ34938.1 hypothetical protein LYNGBM3L_10660 [Moorena producens 3L]NEP36853.1 hypothetical protein [Moorena sp. SIO3B2]NEP67655.1 hypothetical protein [Moorena sp. SIO3A5]